MTTHSNPSIGTNAMHATAYAGLTGTCEEAVELGHTLAREHGLSSMSQMKTGLKASIISITTMTETTTV